MTHKMGVEVVVVVVVMESGILCRESGAADMVLHAGLSLGGIQSAAIAINHFTLGSDLYAPGGTANTKASRKSRAVPSPYVFPSGDTMVELSSSRVKL